MEFNRDGLPERHRLAVLHGGLELELVGRVDGLLVQTVGQAPYDPDLLNISIRADQHARDDHPFNPVLSRFLRISGRWIIERNWALIHDIRGHHLPGWLTSSRPSRLQVIN